jgi:hypothetical protein
MLVYPPFEAIVTRARLRVQEHTYARVATSHYMGAITMCRLLILSFP